MASPFSRTLRSLEADRSRHSLVGLAVAALLLAGWSVWFFGAEVTLYEGAHSARLEVDRESYPVSAPVDGSVTAVFLELDRKVEAGGLLVELDTKALLLAREEEAQRKAALEEQEKALTRELAAIEEVVRDKQRATEAALAETKAQRKEAVALAEFAAEEARRDKKLHAGGHLSDAERDRSQTAAAQTWAASESARLSVERLDWEQRTDVGELRIRQAHLEGEAARLKGVRAMSEAAVARLNHQIEERRIRAPIAGRLGEVASLQEGAFVEEGQVLATVVPPGQLRVVAEFAPRALGRLAEGEQAQLKLDAFPWTQYGAIAARVSRVGREVRQGSIRVELAVTEVPAGILPQHGLPGHLEVEVERLAPAALVLRTVGRALTARPAGATP